MDGLKEMDTCHKMKIFKERTDDIEVYTPS